MKNKIFSAGETIDNLVIDGLPIDYPVLNDRAVRAGAGIMFLIGLVAFINAFYYRDFFYIKIVVVLFFLEFFIRVLINPRYAPISVLGKLTVNRQRPEYVGAIQKRFAWSIGLFLSVSMIILMYVLDYRGVASLTICFICLSVMFLEASFGICVGCSMYFGLQKIGIIRSKVRPICPGGVCEIKH